MADGHGNTDEKAIRPFRRLERENLGEKVISEQAVEAGVGRR